MVKFYITSDTVPDPQQTFSLCLFLLYPYSLPSSPPPADCEPPEDRVCILFTFYEEELFNESQNLCNRDLKYADLLSLYLRIISATNISDFCVPTVRKCKEVQLQYKRYTVIVVNNKGVYTGCVFHTYQEQTNYKTYRHAFRTQPEAHISKIHQSSQSAYCVNQRLSFPYFFVLII